MLGISLNVMVFSAICCKIEFTLRTELRVKSLRIAYEDSEDVVRSLAFNIDSIDLNDLVTDGNQSGSVRGPSVHYSGYENSSASILGFYGGTLENNGI